MSDPRYQSPPMATASAPGRQVGFNLPPQLASTSTAPPNNSFVPPPNSSGTLVSGTNDRPYAPSQISQPSQLSQQQQQQQQQQQYAGMIPSQIPYYPPPASQVMSTQAPLQVMADPFQMSPVGFVIPVQGGFIIPQNQATAAQQAANNRRTVRRSQTVKRIQLQGGHLVVEVPVPQKYLEKVPIKEGYEFTQMRYTAVTCDPDLFADENYILRQRMLNRHTEIAVCMTMYNEDEILFTRTMHNVMKNIKYLCNKSPGNSDTWNAEGWKKVLVVVVADGRKKCNQKTLATLSAMGVYQDGVAKNIVNGKEVTGHLYEFTTQLSMRPDMTLKDPEKMVPVQVLFLMKEKNAKKINSHRWFFRAVCSVIQPRITVLLDVGTSPSTKSIYHLWNAFDSDPDVAGACGEIAVMKGPYWSYLLNPLVAAQNFEYKISNILDKPLESVFGYISVLPGAFSAYRYEALLEDSSGKGPLISYFKGERRAGETVEEGVFEANMYLAEDRILCYELVAKKDSKWILRYVREAVGETDVPDTVAELVLQRRRWLNGSFFAAVYALAHWHNFYKARHSFTRKILFLLEFIYILYNMVFSWFALGMFFLTFYILGKTIINPTLDPFHNAGYYIFYVLLYIYFVLIVCSFIAALGNRPTGSKFLYVSSFIFFAVIMVYATFAAVFMIVQGISTAVNSVPPDQPKFITTADILFGNESFRSIIVAVLGTYGLYIFCSLLYLDPWHMITSFVQYLLIAPAYINVLNVYAFCNTHDVSWGTKGDTSMVINTDLGVANTSEKRNQEVDLQLPTDARDLDQAYEEDLELLMSKEKKEEEVKIPSAQDRVTAQEDYYRKIRTYMVIFWLLSNGALVAAISSTKLASLLSPNDTSVGKGEVDPSNFFISNKFFAFVLYSVAALALFRFLGSLFYVFGRLCRR